MRLFFFHVKIGDQLQHDDIGVRCESEDAAYQDAYASIPELAADLLRDGIDPMECALIIEDAAHQPVFTIPFTARLNGEPLPGDETGKR
jgi:hypothetical protein